MKKLNDIISTAIVVTETCKIPSCPGIYCYLMDNEYVVESSENIRKDLMSVIDERECFIIETFNVLFVDDELMSRMNRRVEEIKKLLRMEMSNLINEKCCENSTVDENSTKNDCVRLTYEELPEVNSERWLSLEDLPGEHWRDCVGFEGKYYK